MCAAYFTVHYFCWDKILCFFCFLIQTFLHKSADTNWEQASQVYSELPGKMVKQIATYFYHIPSSDLKFYPILKKKV